MGLGNQNRGSDVAMIEKTLAFGYPFFLRVIFPGSLASAVLYLILWPWVGETINMADKVAFGLFFSVSTIALGLIVSFADHPIYSLYEARVGWPRWLRRWLVRRRQLEVERRRIAANEATDEQERAEMWSWLRRFPLTEEGEPRALSPTAIGNILYGYEDYPWQRYAMDAVFYWPRIWLMVDDKTRKEIDSLWAPADSLTYLSFIALFGSVVLIPFLVVSLVQSAWSASFVVDLRHLWGAAVPSLILLWRIFYLLSLPLHISNGETFKSVFDVYRGQIENLLPDRDQATYEKKKWHDAWHYLQYYPGPRGRTKPLPENNGKMPPATSREEPPPQSPPSY